MDLHGVFWTYSLFCLICCFYVYYYLPETRGKTLLEIQSIFVGARMTKNNGSNINHQDNFELLQETNVKVQKPG